MAVATFGALALASGCGDDSDGNNGATTDGTEASDDNADIDGLSGEAVITYAYQDSSVPPEYHRSYVLTISHDEVEVVVDSYGDVVGETTEPVPADVWDGLSVGAAELMSVEPEAGDEGCSGGTRRSLVIDDGGETVMDLELDLCGANSAQAEVIDDYLQPVIDAIPTWESLIATE